MRPVPFFLLGLILGGGGVWFAIHRPTPAAFATPPGPAVPVALPSWSWREHPLPPGLPAGTVGPAIAAWLALRAPDGSPAPHSTRADTLRALLARLPAEGFPRLLAVFATITSEQERRLRQLAFDVWTEADAPAATRWAAAAGPGLRDLARQALSAWVALDAPAAAAWACALADPEAATELAPLALAALAAQDPAGARALAASRDEAFRLAVLPSLFESLARTDPAAALRAYGPEVWNRGEGFQQLRAPLRAWASRDPDAALAWLASQSSPSTDPRQLVYWLGNLAPTAEEQRSLGGAVVRNASLPQRAEILAVLMSSRQGRQQPADTLAWLSSHLDPALRLDVLIEMGTYSSSLPETSLPFALALPPSQNRTQSLGRALEAWSKIDSPAALSWIRQQDDPGVTVAAIQVQTSLLANIALSEPATALAEWRALSDPQARAAAIGPISQAWGQTDPAVALRWSAEQAGPLGDNRAPPSTRLIASWARQEPEAALRWTEAYLAKASPESKSRLAQEALGALGGDRQDRMPRAQTADLYLKVEDPTLRTQILETHIAEWLTKDPAAAKTWLESNNALTPAQAAALLTP